jgi:hypothetical protein
MTITPIVPIVHLNGSGRHTLIRERHDLRMALHTTLEKLAAMTPHPRDYYPVEGVFEMAMAQHVRRMEKLQHIVNEIETEMVLLEGEQS